MGRFTVLARTPSNAISSRDYPVLEEGNMAFPNGEYEVAFEKVEGRRFAYSVHHIIRGAPLISRLLSEGSARYACAVSSPKSAYRGVCISETSTQIVDWSENDLGEPPLFTPMILYFNSNSIPLTLESGQDGVHELWDGQTVALEKGSRLAIGMVIERETSFIDLLLFEENDKLDKGSFYVICDEEPFKFRVYLHPDLHKYMESVNEQRTGGVRENIMPHIVTACFAHLQRRYSEDDDVEGWKSHRGLLALADELDSKGLKHWTEDDFRPEEIATTLFPHTFDTSEEDEEYL